MKKSKNIKAKTVPVSYMKILLLPKSIAICMNLENTPENGSSKSSQRKFQFNKILHFALVILYIELITMTLG
jgi:hypothetical protein